jgi:nucleoside diphosphate kinase
LTRNSSNDSFNRSARRGAHAPDCRLAGENSDHGSDAPETEAQEIAQWFAGNEIVG